MRIYAVRMGDYVELRLSDRPPRAKVTKISWISKVTHAKLSLRTVFYLGGRVLGTMKYMKYQRWAGAPKFGRKGRVEIPFSPRAVRTYLDGRNIDW